jgi:CubicO group peptidase (beta-lactamase class C family)
MEIALYILLGIVILVIGFFTWFFIFFLKVPKLKLAPEVSSTQKIEVIDSWFLTLQKENKFNGVVLYISEGKELLAKGYGYTNHKKELKLTKNSSLRLASLSKQFTAAGIMLLNEQGRINYDDLVLQYINGFPYENVTVRHLLNQVSGVPDIYMKLAETQKGKIPFMTNEKAVSLIINENRKTKIPPNEKFQYSNTNYIILARLIEVISGLSFEDYMQQELFTPLGMVNTRIWNLKSKDKTFKNKTDDFGGFQGNFKALKPTFLDGIAGDGAVFSSAKDMFLWDKFWYENSLLKKEHLIEAFKKPILNNGKKSDYGFGWLITEKGMWHNGAWLGANTIIIRNTEIKNCLVILDNSSNIFFGKIIKELKTLVNNG